MRGNWLSRHTPSSALGVLLLEPCIINFVTPTARFVQAAQHNGVDLKNGGCLAAGRGFFHINSHGGAEPCPFSPYSDVNVCDSSLREALRSRLFTRLREDNVLLEEHEGGCVLFEKREAVEAILQEAGV